MTMRYLRIASLTAVLAAVLLLAQITLATHGAGHAFGNGDDSGEAAEVCLECLALCGIQSAPPPTCVATEFSPPTVDQVRGAIVPTPIFTQPLAFRSRAPPNLQS